MKKIKKELKKMLRVFLALSLLFNNLMPLSVVFADELDNNNEEVVVDKVDDETVVPGDDAVTSEDELVSENIVDSAGESVEEPAVEELIYTVTLNEDNQIVIKHNKALDLNEESKLVVIEDMKYVDDTTYGGKETEIELTEDVRTALESEEGYVFASTLLADNLFEGEYSANVTIEEEQRIVNKTIEAEGEGIEFKIYSSSGEEIAYDEELEVYFIESDISSFTVTARLLNGGISPSDKFVIGDDEFTAYEMFEEGSIVEETLEGYLYGKFDYNLSFNYTLGEEEKTVDETFPIMYGSYYENTEKLNNSAKNVELDSEYVFFGDWPNSVIYTTSDEGIEKILDDFVGDSEIISYTINTENDLEVILTDGRVTVTYDKVWLDDSLKLPAKLESDNETINSGDTFTVKYIVTIGEEPINGLSGLVKYDETLLKLVNIESSEFNGNSKENKFLYAGGKLLVGDVQGTEDGSVTVNDKEYTLVTLTFEALKSGEASISVEDAKFYSYDVYFESEEEINTTVVINEATDNTLKSLTVAGQEIELQEDVLEYEITVSSDVTEASVEAVVSNVAASITSIVSPEKLAEGENLITIVVTAENGDEKVYTIKVNKEKTQEEPTVTQVNYQPDNNNYDNGDTSTIEPDNNKTIDNDTKKDDEKEKDNKLSRIIIIILILLVIAGLIYLIFKDDDDEETKKANKEIDKLKKTEDSRKEKNNSQVKKINKNVKKER